MRLLRGVNQQMSLQVVFGFEALPTGGAEERPLVCVHKLVCLQVHFGFERPLTDVAPEGSVLLLLMAQQVELERCRVPELSGTLAAGERPLFFVSVHVLHQMKLPAEALVTDVAYKHPPFLLDLCFLCVLAISVFVHCGTILCSVCTDKMNIRTHVQSEGGTEKRKQEPLWEKLKFPHLKSLLNYSKARIKGENFYLVYISCGFLL